MLIHFNPHLSHQCDHAKAFRSCGFKATTALHTKADVHVISGPWYAYAHYKNHPRTLMIDRAWWGDSEGYVSLGWLQPDGTRKFAQGSAPRSTPRMMRWKTREESALILADYNQNVGELADRLKTRFKAVRVRKHPANSTGPRQSLGVAIKQADVVVGHSGTALFDAIRYGRPVICTDPKNECMPVCSDSLDGELYRGDRSSWLHDMSYKQWNMDEIASGEAWEHLRDIQ